MRGSPTSAMTSASSEPPADLPRSHEMARVLDGGLPRPADAGPIQGVSPDHRRILVERDGTVVSDE